MAIFDQIVLIRLGQLAGIDGGADILLLLQSLLSASYRRSIDHNIINFQMHGSSVQGSLVEGQNYDRLRALSPEL